MQIYQESWLCKRKLHAIYTIIPTRLVSESSQSLGTWNKDFLQWLLSIIQKGIIAIHGEDSCGPDGSGAFKVKSAGGAWRLFLMCMAKGGLWKGKLERRGTSQKNPYSIRGDIGLAVAGTTAL